MEAGIHRLNRSRMPSTVRWARRTRRVAFPGRRHHMVQGSAGELPVPPNERGAGPIISAPAMLGAVVSTVRASR